MTGKQLCESDCSLTLGFGEAALIQSIPCVRRILHYAAEQPRMQDIPVLQVSQLWLAMSDIA